MEYAPQISQGTNRGEAAFLGESSFDPVRASAVLSEQVRRGRKEVKDDRQSFEGLLSDNIKSEWDATSINYFQPKVETLRNEGIEIMKKYQGKIPFDVRKQYEGKWNDLKNEALIDNKVRQAYDAQVKLLDKNPDEFDLEESRRRLEIFKDPTKDPAAMKDLQENFKGNLVKWRAARAEEYTLEPSFSREAYITEMSKPSKLPKRVLDLTDESGQPQYYTDPVSGVRQRLQEAGVTDEQIETVVTSIYNSNQRKDKKLIETDTAIVKDMFVVDNGKVLPSDPNDALAIEVLQQAAPRLKGKANDEEIIKELARAYTFTDIRKRNPVSQQFRNVGKKTQPRSSGSGAPESRLVATVEPLVDYTEEDIYRITGLGKDGGIEMGRKSMPKGGTYIALAKQGRGQTKEEGAKTLLDAGKGEMQLIGFNVRPDGSVLMDYSFTNEINDFINGKSSKRAVVRNYDITAKENSAILAQVANQYGFEKGQDFIDYLNREAAKKNPRHKVQGKQKTETKTVPTKPGTPTNQTQTISPKRKWVPRGADKNN